MGDAAHSIHPLAGQGMNLGITDAALLGNALIRAKRMGEDIGRASVLQEYESGAMKNAYSMSVTIDSLFSEYKRGGQLRNLGYAMVQASGVLKQNMMNFASGVFTHPLEYEW